MTLNKPVEYIELSASEYDFLPRRYGNKVYMRDVFYSEHSVYCLILLEKFYGYNTLNPTLFLLDATRKVINNKKYNKLYKALEGRIYDLINDNDILKIYNKIFKKYNNDMFAIRCLSDVIHLHSNNMTVYKYINYFIYQLLDYYDCHENIIKKEFEAYFVTGEKFVNK